MSETTLRLDDIMAAVRTVPAMSAGASQLLQLMGQPTYAVADIVRVIETDPALTVNVLKMINSAAMGLRRELTSVQEAVVYLGDTKIVAIALASSAGEVFNAELRGYQGARGDLGRHCLWAAIASRQLARYTDGVVDKGTAFTAGLLHDIGKAVISDFLAEVAPDAPGGGGEVADGSHLDAEDTTLGTNHCIVGEAMGFRWKMPAPLIAAIRHHHRPELAPDEHKAIAYVVHLADTLAMMFGTGTGLDDMQYDLDSGYDAYVKLDQNGLEGLALDVQLDFRATAEALFDHDQETVE